MSEYRTRIAIGISNLIKEHYGSTDLASFVFCRLSDGMLPDNDHTLVQMYAVMDPSDTDLIAVKEGRVTSLLESDVVLYRRVK